MTASASHSLPAGPRYSIIPAAAGTDRRFKGRDLQILVLIGRHTDRNGWCRLNQGKLAALLDLSRSTVNRSISRLCELGYLEIRQQFRADGGQAASSYRVRMDVDDALAGPAIDIEYIEDGDDEGQSEGAVHGGEPLDVVAPPVANLHTPLCTQSAHPPVHSGCTPLTTPLSNDQKKAQSQKKADGDERQEAQDLPQAGTCHPGDDPRQDDEGAERGADADDGALDEERAAARSASARKAAETRLLHQALNDWPGGMTERRPAIDEAWGGMSAEDKRSAVERIPVYLRRAAADKRKPGRLARYLAEAPWRALPAPKAVRAPEEGPKHLLPWSVVETFLAHETAREVLAMAYADEVVLHLADAVREPRRVPTKAEYIAWRAEWMARARVWHERACQDETAPSVWRSAAPAWLEVWRKWQDFARGVLEGEGASGGAPPGEARDAAE